jgi:cellulose synthase/poly-beta-1,6-N-acetylglucosamine synthase-like glycosyltransferase
MAEVLLYGSLLVLFYIYFGYPAVLFLLAKMRPRKIAAGTSQPRVTILISAYNEEACIGPTIQNKLDQDYPPDRLEIIVISDGSTDRTDEIVSSFTSRGVKLIRQNPRSGKTSALNRGMLQAGGEIVVFSDANSIYATDAVRNLVWNFDDPDVGYVTGKMIYMNQDGTMVGDGCSTYMRYENVLRTLETQVHSIVGVDGGIDAVRRSLYEPMRPDQLPDFILPLKVIEKHHRVIYEPAAVLRELSLGSAGDEYRMRVRVTLRSLWALWEMRQLLNLKRYGVFAWELLSHKYLRYAAFLFLLTFYGANAALWNDHAAYRLLFAAQNAFYLSAVLCLVLEWFDLRIRLLYVPYYFTLINLASAHAFLKFSGRRKQVLWAPRKG